MVCLIASLVAQTVKRLSTMWETWVRALGWEDPWRRKWQSTPVLLPGKSHGQRSLVGYSLWDRKESDTTEWLHFHCGYQDVVFFFLKLLIYIFAALVLVVAHGIFHCSVQILWLWHTCSVVGAQGPSFKACGILVPWPGIEPTSPALQGRFLITGPPGMSLTFFFYLLILYWSIVPGESHGQRSLVNYSP